MTMYRLLWIPAAIITIAAGFPAALVAQGNMTDIIAADSVVTVVIGEKGGRGEDLLPDNVLGLPDSTARVEVPATDPAEVLSLGLGGEIVLHFSAHVVVDGEGDDLVVFENVFTYRLGNAERIYAEPAEVAVSRDGIDWRVFPIDHPTLDGAAGVTPTDGRFLPTDERSGGDRFDLADLGIDSIRYVRIRDVSSIVLEDINHVF